MVRTGDWVAFKSPFRKAVGIVESVDEAKASVRWLKTSETTKPFIAELRPVFKGEIDQIILELTKKMVELEEMIQKAYLAQKNAIEAKYED